MRGLRFPEDRSYSPKTSAGGDVGEGLSFRGLMREKRYWAIAICGCVLSGSGGALVTHIVPMPAGWGYPTGRAAALLSVVGFCGIPGSLLLGWLAEQIGGPASVSLNAALRIFLWLALLLEPSFPVILILATVFGLTGGRAVACLTASFSQLFGAASFTRAHGLFALVNLPFTVGLPILAVERARRCDRGLPSGGHR